MWSIKDRRQCVLPWTFFVWMIVLGFILILAFTKKDSKVNGKFKTLDMYRKEYGDMNSDKAKAYTSRLITEVCMSLFSLSFPFFFFQQWLKTSFPFDLWHGVESKACKNDFGVTFFSAKDTLRQLHSWSFQVLLGFFPVGKMSWLAQRAENALTFTKKVHSY